MHLLYLDDSGSVANAGEEYLVLGGVSVYEAQVGWITRRLDEIAESIHPEGNPHLVEFRASEIFSRRRPAWKHLSKDAARGAIKSVLRVLGDEAYDSAHAFACVVHKDSYPDADPMRMAFEDLCSRFDTYLETLARGGNRQHGLVILDKSTYETKLQAMALELRTTGTQWGRRIRHVADTPFFVDSHASRVIQLADHVAYAVFRRFQAKDTQYFDCIARKFYSVDNVVHGLAHKEGNANRDCMCPGCVTRRIAKGDGPSSP